MKVSSRRGISIVTLVITIIVMIILTTAVVMTMNETNIIGRHKVQ